jgi:hypothetical protein
MQPTPTSRTTAVARAAAYRRLTVAILRLDVPTLAADLRAQRLQQGCPARLPAPRGRRAA